MVERSSATEAQGFVLFRTLNPNADLAGCGRRCARKSTTRPTHIQLGRKDTAVLERREDRSTLTVGPSLPAVEVAHYDGASRQAARPHSVFAARCDRNMPIELAPTSACAHAAKRWGAGSCQAYLPKAVQG